MEIELENRRCAFVKCTNVFKVMPNSADVACSSYCREELMVRSDKKEAQRLRHLQSVKRYAKKNRHQETRRLKELFVDD